MSNRSKALLAVVGLVFVAACAQREPEVVYEPVAPVTEYQPTSKYGK